MIEDITKTQEGPEELVESGKAYTWLNRALYRKGATSPCTDTDFDCPECGGGGLHDYGRCVVCGHDGDTVRSAVLVDPRRGGALPICAVCAAEESALVTAEDLTRHLPGNAEYDALRRWAEQVV